MATPGTAVAIFPGMKIALLFATALGLAGCASEGAGDSKVCARPLASFTDCAPTLAEQQRQPPGGDPAECTSCEMCHFYSGKCGKYHLWAHSWAFGEERECVYDEATGALVGAMRKTDHVLEGCDRLVAGVTASRDKSCGPSSPPDRCDVDGGRD
jgi:hypothetical protein